MERRVCRVGGHHRRIDTQRSSSSRLDAPSMQCTTGMGETVWRGRHAVIHTKRSCRLRGKANTGAYAALLGPLFPTRLQIAAAQSVPACALSLVRRSQVSRRCPAERQASATTISNSLTLPSLMLGLSAPLCTRMK
eukprot:scaffold310605_cov36-Tisochrysis_lutea.AAC.2